MSFRAEVAFLSNELWMIRQQEQINRQDQEKTKREANSTSKPIRKIQRFSQIVRGQKVSHGDKKCHSDMFSATYNDEKCVKSDASDKNCLLTTKSVTGVVLHD